MLQLSLFNHFHFINNVKSRTFIPQGLKYAYILSQWSIQLYESNSLFWNGRFPLSIWIKVFIKLKPSVLGNDINSLCKDYADRLLPQVGLLFSQNAKLRKATNTVSPCYTLTMWAVSKCSTLLLRHQKTYPSRSTVSKAKHIKTKITSRALTWTFQ